MKSEIAKAKYMWWMKCRFNWENSFLPEHLLKADFPRPPARGWIRSLRESLMISQEQTAGKLNLSRQAFAKLEVHEMDGSISLSKLESTAEALDCEFVYFLRPKSRQLVSDLIWKKVFPEAMDRYQRRTRVKRVEPLILATIATNLMEETKIRRQHKWLRKSWSPKPRFEK